MKYDIRQAAQALVSQLKAIDYERLPISKYNKRYIARLKPVLSYYMKIYADCILKGLESIGSSPEEITLIDYGGGSGFLSILAKQAGIGRVIYIDLNPDSVDTIRILKELVNTGPDMFTTCRLFSPIWLPSTTRCKCCLQRPLHLLTRM